MFKGACLEYVRLEWHLTSVALPFWFWFVLSKFILHVYNSGVSSSELCVHDNDVVLPCA